MNHLHFRFLLFLVLTISSPFGGWGANPLISTQFSADPTARVFNGRLYLFPSHDILSPVEPEKQWFCMADYHMFSSDNLTDWTDHGVILSQEQVPWGNPQGYAMWAPDCVEKDGKYYFFYPDGVKDGMGFGIGVAIADKPEGPYIPQESNITGLSGIDPCVLQTSKGENYIFWGAGGVRAAKMKDNLLELADEELQNPAEGPHGMKFYGHTFDELPRVGLQEGPFAFERNGKFYLTYPYVRYKKGDIDEQGDTIDNATEALVYAMSDAPMGPYEYKGVIMKEHQNHCWTNHHSIVEYKGQWYLFYHHNDYSPSFDKNRSVCVDSLTFNPDGTIQEVIPTLRGVGVTDAAERVQMDRYSAIGGGASIAYNDTTNYFLGWKTILPKGGWVSYGNVAIPDSLTPPSGARGAWLCQPGFWGRSMITDIEKTQLKLEVKKQPNGLYELKLMNEGEKTEEVDWISLNSRQPLVPGSTQGMLGSYRNLFVEAGYSPEDVEKKLQQVFNEVFVNKKTKCYFETSISSPRGGQEGAYISDIKNHDVRTEGMSYGMMIAVQFDRKDIFDCLWRWTKRYMLIDEGPNKGYFRWSCKTDGTPNAQGPASDGELYFITSLIFASNRWGNTGEIDYLKDAQAILDAIQPRETEFTMTRDREGKPLDKPLTIKRTSALIDPETKLISFVPGMPFTDPSYHIPVFYEVWARYANDGRASYWRECAQKSREYLHKCINPITGLNTDYSNFDGSPINRHGMGDAFRYDSWRVPMNIALDYTWAGADKTWQENYGNTVQNFFYSQGIDSFVDQYNADGSQPDRLIKAGDYPEKLRHSVGLVSTLAAASLMCSHAKSYEFIDRLWNSKNEPNADGYFDAYYDGLLRLFAFMHLSGHYRVIEQTPQLDTYFKPATAEPAKLDEEGFIRRWTIHDPISKPNRSNTIFTDTYINETFPEPIKTPTAKEISKNSPQEALPLGGARRGARRGAVWKTYDSQFYNSKLFRLASCTGQQKYGVIFWVTTTIECDEDIEGVRFGIGSNGASKWWCNGEEVALLSGDRRMVRDDMISKMITLHKGKNIITGAIINGPGMSDFCLRLLDNSGKPITNVKIK